MSVSGWAATLSLLALGMVSAAELHIDHVTIAGEHLSAMRDALQKAAGIASEYGGPHSNHATEMALTSFPDGSYLELIATQPQADPKAVAAFEWSRFMETNGGPCAFAARVTDVKAEAERLRAAGIPVGTPVPNGRTRPDGVSLKWSTADIGSEGRGSFFPFLIQDFTPRDNRVYPSGKPTTDAYRGIGKVVLAVRDLPSAIAQYRRAYAWPEPKTQHDADFDANLAWFEGTPIVLAQGLSETSWVAKRVREYGESPCAFVLTANQPLRWRTRLWFGRPLMWVDEKSLGWRLAVEAPR